MNPPASRIDLLDVTAIARQARAFLCNLRGLGKDAHACPSGTPDRAGRAFSILLASMFFIVRDTQ